MGFKCTFAYDVIFPFENIPVYSPMKSANYLLKDVQHVCFRKVKRKFQAKMKGAVSYEDFFLRILYIFNYE